MTDLAREYGISRETVYNIAAQGEQALLTGLEPARTGRLALLISLSTLAGACVGEEPATPPAVDESGFDQEAGPVADRGDGDVTVCHRGHEPDDAVGGPEVDPAMDTLNVSVSDFAAIGPMQKSSVCNKTTAARPPS